MNQIKESYGTEIININDVFQLKLVEGYYYKPFLIEEPKKPINGILFRDYREHNSWEVVWSFSENKMDVGVLHNDRNQISYLIKQQIQNNKN
jgi:hypothetical protein